MGVMFMLQLLAVCCMLGLCSAVNVPAVYIFGDSLVDVGNNFYLNTNARPVYPNGIDFGNDHYPSGRYTNRRTVVDIIEQEAGFNFTPPFFAPTTVGDVILKGVNYASSGSGILDDDGEQYGSVTNMEEQIRNFEKTRQDIISRIGESAAKSLLRQSLYVIVTGSNDILWDRIPQFDFPSQGTYVEDLIFTFRSQLNRLYSLGARKFIVTNCPKIGCIPFEKDAHPFVEGCYAPTDKLTQLYNQNLKNMLIELTTKLAGSIYVYADIYTSLESILQNYTSHGFDYPDSACCHLAGRHGGLIPCFTLSQVCPDRSKYVFWDPYHPTEATNLIVANYFMDGDLNYVSPVNIRQLLNF